MDGHQGRRIAPRQGVVGAGGEHQAPGDVGLGHGAAGMEADGGGEHRADASSETAEQQRVDAADVDVGQFCDVADAHQDVDIGKLPPQAPVPQQRIGEAEEDRFQHRISVEGPAPRPQPPCPLHDARHRQPGRIDDFGEQAHRMAGEIDPPRRAAEPFRQVGQFVGAALHRQAEMGRQAFHVAAAAPRH